MARTSYLIALGSNRRHGRHGAPARVVAAAIRAIEEHGQAIRCSKIRSTAALGGAGRSFANAAVLLQSDLEPDRLLAALRAIEIRFGRRPGRRWAPRVLDLDIILWSGGVWHGERLVIPHPALATRDFVLQPLAEITPGWRHPLTGLTVRQLRARLRVPRPVDRFQPRP